MSHYDINYSDLPTKADKDAKALQDVKDYLSEKQWSYIQETFYSHKGFEISYSVAKQWLKAMSFACMMTGIQGYPVRAMKRKFLAQFVKKESVR